MTSGSDWDPRREPSLRSQDRTSLLKLGPLWEDAAPPPWVLGPPTCSLSFPGVGCVLLGKGEPKEDEQVTRVVVLEHTHNGNGAGIPGEMLGTG